MTDMRWIGIVILCFVVSYCYGEVRHWQGVKHGRIEKHAETMEFIAGNRNARIAIVNPEKGITYHPEGTCAVCHSS
jgi:hypothetical protein